MAANVYAYLRKSRAEKKMEEDDPALDVLRWHRATLQQLVQQDRLSVPGEHWFEEIESGGRITSRPHFQRLLDAWRRLPVRAGGVIYCMDADRLSRGILRERGEVQEIILRARLRIRTPTGFTDLWDTDQRLLHNIKGDLAEWELAKFKDRVENTIMARTLEGIPGGRVPYGWMWDRNAKPKRVVAHPTEFPIVVALCREGFHVSTVELARRYGLRQDQVWRLLTNPFVAGYPARRHYNQEGTYLRLSDGAPRRNQSALRPREEWELARKPGDYPPAMTLEEWQRLQVVLKERGTLRLKCLTPAGWCREVVQFVGHPEITSVCLSSSPRQRKGGVERHLTYEGRVRDRVVVTISRAAVHAAAFAALARLWSSAPVATAPLLAAAAQWQAQQETPGEDAARLSQSIAAKRSRLAQLWATTPEDALDAAAIRQAQEQIKKEIKGLEAALRSVQTHTAADPLLADALPLVVDRLRDFGTVWEQFEDRERKIMVRGTLAALQVDTARLRRGRRDHYRDVFRAVYTPPILWLAEQFGIDLGE